MSVEVREGVPPDPPPWAIRLARPDLTGASRSWYARRDGVPIAGLILWEGSIRTARIELPSPDPEAATALIEAAARSGSSPLELTVDAADPVVPHEALRALGFAEIEALVRVERALESLPTPDGGLLPRPWTELPARARALLFARVVGSSRPDPLALHDRLLRESGAGADPRLWAALTLDAEPAGVLFPVRDPVRPSVGSIAFAGLVPELRGRGLGHPMLLLGLHALRRMGSRRYVDFTEAANGPMRAILQRAGCAETGSCATWRANDQ